MTIFITRRRSWPNLLFSAASQLHDCQLELEDNQSQRVQFYLQETLSSRIPTGPQTVHR